MIINNITIVLHSNPHAIWRHITGGQLKKAAEKLKKPTHEGEIIYYFDNVIGS